MDSARVTVIVSQTKVVAELSLWENGRWKDLHSESQSKLLLHEILE